jgi:hypothetical protein
MGHRCILVQIQGTLRLVENRSLILYARWFTWGADTTTTSIGRDGCNCSVEAAGPTASKLRWLEISNL